MLNLLITSVPEFVTHITVLSGEFSSDHMLITFDIIIPLKRIKPFKRYVYNYKDADFDGLQEFLFYIPWDIVYDENDMDLSTVKWMDLFLAAVNDCVPKIEIKSANSASWIDAEVLKAVRRKERLRKRAKRSSSTYHSAIFRLHRAELKSLIKWKRKQYFKGLSTTLTENPKRFWAYYQAKYKNKRIPTSLQYNRVKVSDAQEKAELFNNYFNSVFKRDDCVPLHEDYFFSGFDNYNQSLRNITLSPSMARKFLDQLNAIKSCGPDEITPRLLKECSKSLSIPLCTLFNKQLDSGCFLIVWKVANLVPVFKSDDREMVENYRVISLLCIISKVLENVCSHTFFPSSNRKFTTCKTALLVDALVLPVFSDLLMLLPKHSTKESKLTLSFWIIVRHLTLSHLTVY